MCWHCKCRSDWLRNRRPSRWKRRKRCGICRWLNWWRCKWQRWCRGWIFPSSWRNRGWLGGHSSWCQSAHFGDLGQARSTWTHRISHGSARRSIASTGHRGRAVSQTWNRRHARLLGILHTPILARRHESGGDRQKSAPWPRPDEAAYTWPAWLTMQIPV